MSQFSATNKCGTYFGSSFPSLCNYSIATHYEDRGAQELCQELPRGVAAQAESSAPQDGGKGLHGEVD